MFDERIMLVFGEFVKNHPEFTETVAELEKVARARGTIRSLCGTDDMEEIKKLLGSTQQGVLVDEEFIRNAETVSLAYEDLYQTCCRKMQEVAEA